MCSVPINTAHTVQCSLFTSVERIARAWLKELQRHLRLKRVCHLVSHMSHPLLLSHLPFTTSTSSSSFTLPSTTTPEHAPQLGQHDLLQEHPVHHKPSEDLPVDRQRHQESLWRENPAEWQKPAHDILHMFCWSCCCCCCYRSVVLGLGVRERFRS